jgi:hypothetical protein
MITPPITRVNRQCVILVVHSCLNKLPLVKVFVAHLCGLIDMHTHFLAVFPLNEYVITLDMQYFAPGQIEAKRLCTLQRHSTAPNPEFPSKTYMRLIVSTAWLRTSTLG